MECVPTAKVDVLNFATPPARVSVANVEVPSLNVTLPVGVPVNSGLTVAVKVTDSPCVDGFADDATVAVLVALLTTCFNTADVLVLNEVLPL